MLILKVLSVLLSYPQKETLKALNEMKLVVEKERLLQEPYKAALLNFIASLANLDLIDWQERYVATFDQSRSFSLHMFEHVHGESPTRGQAMVDLLEFYRAHGFDISALELPDYLPLFLEFAAHQTTEEALGLLKESLPIISALSERLAKQDNAWQAVLRALVGLIGQTSKNESCTQAVVPCADEVTREIDQQWQEAPQLFTSSQTANSPCHSCKFATNACSKSNLFHKGQTK